MFNPGPTYQQLQATTVLSTTAQLKVTLLALTCCLVSACGDVEPIIKNVTTLQPRPQLVEIIPVATSLKTLPQAVEILMQPEPTAEPPTDTDPALEHIVLDLNLSTEILATGHTDVSTLQLNMNKLPDLFEQSEKEPKTSFYVELLRNENIPQATKNIDGLNLTIERRLGG